MKLSAIVITGGAGYIGSHILYTLVNRGYTVVVIDWQPEPWYLQSLISKTGGMYVSAHCADARAWDVVTSLYTILAVVHCAAYINVGESVLFPDKYYENNVQTTLSLLKIMRKYDIGSIVFSSSCAVYGEPQYVPLDESHPTNPVSPYGASKLMVEHMLADMHRAYGICFASLRYFNAIGAVSEYFLGERHTPETHIVPLLINAVREKHLFTIFGDDYDTPDGTCIRDYVHVLDLADAHVRALEYLFEKKKNLVANLGTQIGYSVREIIHAVEAVMGEAVGYLITERRPGDPGILCADAKLASRELLWVNRYTLHEALESAYLFHLEYGEQKVKERTKTIL